MTPTPVHLSPIPNATGGEVEKVFCKQIGSTKGGQRCLVRKLIQLSRIRGIAVLALVPD